MRAEYRLLPGPATEREGGPAIATRLLRVVAVVLLAYVALLVAIVAIPVFAVWVAILALAGRPLTIHLPTTRRD